jgi:hypothetical protein
VPGLCDLDIPAGNLLASPARRARDRAGKHGRSLTSTGDFERQSVRRPCERMFDPVGCPLLLVSRSLASSDLRIRSISVREPGPSCAVPPQALRPSARPSASGRRCSWSAGRQRYPEDAEGPRPPQADRPVGRQSTRAPPHRSQARQCSSQVAPRDPVLAERRQAFVRSPSSRPCSCARRCPRQHRVPAVHGLSTAL